MMSTANLQFQTFSHPDVESCITNLEHELNDFVVAQAREDAKRDSELTEALYTIKVVDPIRSKVQTAIDFIKQILLPTSKVFDAREIELIAQKRVGEITNETNERLHTRAALKRKINSIVLDPLKKFGKWLMAIALCVGAADGGLAYANFRIVYTTGMAIIASCAIGAVISFSHLAYAGWIKRVRPGFQRNLRIAVVLLVAALVFSLAGNLRANASKQTVNIALEGDTVSAANSRELNGWTVAGVSSILFVGVLSLSLLFWKNKKERQDEQEYDKLKKEMVHLDAELKSLEKEKNEVEQNVHIQKSSARQSYDYAIRSLNKCMSIGKHAITKYKRDYVRFRNDNVPGFFSQPDDLVYDQSFHFFTPQQSEII